VAACECDWPRLLDRAVLWTASDRLLIRAASALWATGNRCDLGSLVTVLDDEELRSVLTAIRLARRWITWEQALDALEELALQPPATTYHRATSATGIRAASEGADDRSTNA